MSSTGETPEPDLYEFLRGEGVPPHMMVGSVEPAKELSLFSRGELGLLKKELAATVPLADPAARAAAEALIDSPQFTEFLAWQRLGELRGMGRRMYEAEAVPFPQGVAVLQGAGLRADMHYQTLVIGREGAEEGEEAWFLDVGPGDETVSRRHCTVLYDPKTPAFLLINHSKNGTRVDGILYTDQVAPLRPSSSIELGQGLALVFHPKVRAEQ